MALYRQNSTGFLCEFSSSPGAGYTAVTAMPGDTEGRVTWWRDRCVDAALGQSSEWHPSLSGAAESSSGRSGDGKNYLGLSYAPFVRDIDLGQIPFYWDGTGGLVGDNSGSTNHPITGSQILQAVAYATGNNLFFGSSATDYNLTLTPNSRWIVSAWVMPDTPGAHTLYFRVRASTGTYYTSAAVTTGADTTKFKRVSGVVDMLSSSASSGVLCIQLGAVGGTGALNFDGVMMERQVDIGSDPSAFTYGVS